MYVVYWRYIIYYINSQIYFWNKTLHISDSSSVHHQEFFTVHTAMVYVIQVCWQLASRIKTEPAAETNQFRSTFSNKFIFNSSTKIHFVVAPHPLEGHSLHIINTSWSYSDTPHSVGLLCMSDQPDTETWQHTKLTKGDKHVLGGIRTQISITSDRRPKL
jgi:hypothetical protein